MAAALLITLRETLEASLITGIVLSYLEKTQQLFYKKYVWFGVAAGVGASILGAILFNILAGGFEGRAEEIFEGVTMLVGAGLLTTMIVWMAKQKGRMKTLQEKVASHVDNARKFELFSLVFLAVLREGIETVIFLNAARFATESGSLTGAGLGVVIAIIIGYALYRESLKLNMKKFFTITSILLILFAAGLVAHGIHELEEAGVVPIVVEHVWDINHFFDENGAVGEILKGLFGYNGNPSLVEVLSYILYLNIITVIWRQIVQPKPVDVVQS